MPRNHYDALEVSRSASPEVLRAAYKSLIQRYHPDRNPGDANAAERAALVVKAYQVLSDPAMRAGYDLELARQADSQPRLSQRRRDLPASAAVRGKEAVDQWRIWVPTALLALFLWFFWTAFLSAPPAVMAPKTIASPLDLAPQKESNEKELPGERTVPNFIENLRVTLSPQRDAANPTPHEVTRILSIKTIGLVAGGSDAEKYVELLNSSKEYIARKLSERLVSADYEMLAKNDGDRYLKQLILNALSEITNTQRLVPGASPGKALATHYGVVDVLLPASYSVESRLSAG